MTILRCQAEVLKRDTYRYSGRGTSGFSMHYSTEQCSFKSQGTRQKYDETLYLCKRHLNIFDRSMYLIQQCTYHKEWEPRKVQL